MDIFLSKKYIVKLNSNISYSFYLGKNDIIHYNIYNADGVLVDNKQVGKNKSKDFSVTVDLSDKIHLVCIASDGNLLYYILKNSQWKHKIISKLDIRSNTYRYLMLYKKNKSTHILYCRSNLLNPIVSAIEHLHWDDRDISKHTVTSYLAGERPVHFQAGVDSFGNIHLVYKALYKSTNQLYYVRYKIRYKKWSLSEMVSNPQNEQSHPSILVDKNDNMHIIWCAIENSHFALKYQTRPNVYNIKSKWTPTLNIFNDNSNYLAPTLIETKNILKLYCKKNNHIFETSSVDKGKNWTQIKVAEMNEENNMELFCYITNDITNNKKLSISQLYGTANSTIKFVGINIYPMKEPNNCKYKIQHQDDTDSSTSISYSSTYSNDIGSTNLTLSKIKKRLHQIRNEQEELRIKFEEYQKDLQIINENIICTYEKCSLLDSEITLSESDNLSLIERIKSIFK
ncbi:MAG: hypothetical protein ACLKAO_00105 [Alkaliphilus sp.]